MRFIRKSYGEREERDTIRAQMPIMKSKPPLYYRIVRVIGKMTWIRWGVRYKIFTSLKPVNIEFAVPFFGCVYRGNLDNFIDRVVYFFGAHEREVMRYTGAQIPAGGVVLDIGANVGHHALFYSTKAGEVHAFEPNPAFHDEFDTHMNDNHVTNVHLHKFGIGNRTQEAAYYAPTGDNHGIGSFIEGHESSNESIGALSVVKGDEAVAALGLSRLDFIKIDVEGYEESVLRGLQETLQKFKPIIVMEYERGEFSSAESFAVLTKGYTPYLLRANMPVLGIFNDPTCRVKKFDFERAHGEVLLVPEG